MFEFLINPKKAEKRPWELFFIGLLYSIIAIAIVDLLFIDNQIFSNYASIMIILFTVMLCLPFVYYLIAYEEKKEILLGAERKILKEHSKAILALTFLFLGLLLGYSLAALVLPHEIDKKNFEIQRHTYCNINMPYDTKTCMDYLLKGNIKFSKPQYSLQNMVGRFFSILSNNIYVLIFSLLFSFIFGSGAIFILTWNASVIAIAISSLAKARNFGLAFTHYMLHGFPEIIAYFIAGLAGGIISTAIIRHDYKTKKFWIILRDSIDLIIIALVFLILSSIIEVFISPLIF